MNAFTIIHFIKLLFMPLQSSGSAKFLNVGHVLLQFRTAAVRTLVTLNRFKP